jgi:hypothetical protein
LRVADGVADQLDGLAKSVVDSLEESLLARFGQNYVPLPDDMVELRRLVTDYRALGRRVVADQLEVALRRRLIAAVSEYTTGIMSGRHWDGDD